MTHSRELRVSRVAALYDIHGNLPALEAVLADAQHEGVDHFVFGGDVATGPMPRETIEQLIALFSAALFVRGNADRELVEAFDQRPRNPEQLKGPAQRALAHCAQQISKAHRDFLATFHDTLRLRVGDLGPVLFCHGSPRSDTEIITRVTSEERMRSILGDVDGSVVVCGHTHQQFDRRVDGWRVINAGSVGLPYEGSPGAFWALLGSDVELRRSPYDVGRASETLRARGFPDLEEMLRESLLEPVNPHEVSIFFERQAQAIDAPLASRECSRQPES